MSLTSPSLLPTSGEMSASLQMSQTPWPHQRVTLVATLRMLASREVALGL